MKALNNTVASFLFILFISSIISSCKTSKETIVKQQYLEGIYCTQQMPADIGEPYRMYLKFKKDGTVLSLSSSLNCDTVNKIIEKNYAEVGKYNFIKKDSIKFTFVNNRINNNEYTATYRGVIIDNKNLKFTKTIKYKGSDPYKLEEKYAYCP